MANAQPEDPAGQGTTGPEPGAHPPETEASPAPPRLGLVLSGGGAPAAYFGAGVALAIEDAGLRPTLYSGVSAGALNCAVLSTGASATDLADLWKTTPARKIYRPRTDVWRLFDAGAFLGSPTGLLDRILAGVTWTWLLSAEPGRARMAETLGGEQVKVASGDTLVVSAVDQSSADVVRFANELPPAHRLTPAEREGPEGLPPPPDRFLRVELTVDHLMASAAAPLLFPPGRLDDSPDLKGRDLVDAGLVANTPLKPALAYEPDAVIVVSASGIKRPTPSPASLGEAIGLLAENVAHFALLSDYKHAETVNTLVAVDPAAAAPKKHVDMLLIEPRGYAFTAPSFLRFNEIEAYRVIDLGRKLGEAALSSWQAADRFR
jgi:NTE family protein